MPEPARISCGTRPAPDRLQRCARALRSLSRLLFSGVRWASKGLLRRALAINEKSHSPEDPAVATRLNNLATVLQATNRLVEAEPLLRRALAITEKSR